MLTKFLTTLSFVALGLLFVIFNTVTPSTAGPLVILVVFLCLYVIIFATIAYLMWAGHRLVGRLFAPFFVRKPLRPIELDKAYYFSSILALVPVMLIAMQSIGGLGAYETALVILFAFVGCVYVAKRTA